MSLAERRLTGRRTRFPLPALRSSAAAICTSPRVLDPGHGHSHGHRLPPQADPQLKRAATAVVNVSLLSDLSLAIIKGAAGAWTGSSALITDAVHSAADMLISTTVLLSQRLSSQPPDSDHPYGHGRFDTLGALAVSTLLVFSGGSLGLRAFESIQHALSSPDGKVEPLISVMDEVPAELLTDPQTAGLALAACFASMGIKEALYRWSMRVGMAQRSQALIANAAHHRADSLSSLVAAVGIGGAMAGVPVLDPLAAVGIAAMIGKLGIDTGLTAARELVDTRLDDELLQDVEEVAEKHEDILGIRKLRARRMGPSTLIDLEIGVRPDITVAAAGAVADSLRREVFSRRPEVTEAIVSTFPLDPSQVSSVPLPVNHHRPHDAGSSGSSHGHSRGEGGHAVASGASALPPSEAVKRQVRSLLESAHGVKRLTLCEVMTTSRPSGSEAGGVLGVRVRARIQCDMNLQLREALGIARRAKARLLDEQGSSGFRITDTEVELETNPV